VSNKGVKLIRTRRVGVTRSVPLSRRLRHVAVAPSLRVPPGLWCLSVCLSSGAARTRPVELRLAANASARRATLLSCHFLIPAAGTSDAEIASSATPNPLRRSDLSTRSQCWEKSDKK